MELLQRGLSPSSQHFCLRHSVVLYFQRFPSVAIISYQVLGKGMISWWSGGVNGGVKLVFVLLLESCGGGRAAVKVGERKWIGCASRWIR